MKEFVDKLIGRLEERKEHWDRDDWHYERDIVNLDDAIDIVNELAEEYNNGWIEKLLEAKECCSEDSDCSKCPFGQIEERCILAELQITGGNNGWIACSERLPDEHDSMFAKHKGTDKWNDAMFEKLSDDVNVTVKYEDGTKKTKTLHTVDGKWNTDSIIKYEVIAWQPIPEPFKEGE